MDNNDALKVRIEEALRAGHRLDYHYLSSSQRPGSNWGYWKVRSQRQYFIGSIDVPTDLVTWVEEAQEKEVARKRDEIGSTLHLFAVTYRGSSRRGVREWPLCCGTERSARITVDQIYKNMVDFDSPSTTLCWSVDGGESELLYSRPRPGFGTDDKESRAKSIAGVISRKFSGWYAPC